MGSSARIPQRARRGQKVVSSASSSFALGRYLWDALTCWVTSFKMEMGVLPSR
jgi:hypothetical protein